MIVSTIQTSNCTPQTIVIGRRGTYDTMQIAFDLSYLVESFGNGVAVLAVKRSQDESAYPAVTTQEDNMLTWTVSETDTYYVGAGEAQLMWYVDGGLAKTIIYPMVVMRDILATSEDAPDAYQNWIESLTALGAETLQNAQNAEQSASDAEDAKDDAATAKEAAEAAQQAAETAVTHYPAIQYNYWMVWDSATQQYVSTGIQAEGEDGYSPEVTITSIEGGHRVTITDKDHPQGQSFDVMDGQGGGGSSDYTDLTNKPQINGHTLTGNQTAAQLGLGTYSKPNGGIPKTDLASDVQTSLGKADTALQSAPVTSVAGKTGAVTLAAGDVSFDASTTYASGTVGKTLSDELNAISQLEETVLPETTEITEALAFYPIDAPNGSTVVVESKNGAEYPNNWALLFYAADKTTVLQATDDIRTSETVKQIIITETGIAYARPNSSFAGDAVLTICNGSSLVEKVEDNTNKIAVNADAISKNAKEIEDVKVGKNNLYDGISLILGRVFNGVYSDLITSVHCTDYLPIVPGRTYAIYGGLFDQNYSNYYDKNKVYKGSLPLAGLNNTYPFADSYNFLLFTAPSDAAYTRINFLNANLIDGTDLRPEWYFRDVTDLAWAKKKLLVIGDSISTDVYGNYKKWVTDLQDEGFISNGLVNNNSQHATGFVATYSGDSTTTFINRLIAVGDLTGLDVVITFGGINDWIQSIDFDAFKAAVDTYFSYLIEHATQARIIVLSPLHTALYGTTNSAGKTQKDYDDYIKSVAKDYAFPCLNLTDESGFCPDKSATFSDMWTLLPAGFSDHDGVHPIETWEKNFLAPMIKWFLSGM